MKDLEDGDTLLDMIATSTQTERTTVKRGEAIYPEVPHSILPSNISTSQPPEFNQGFYPGHSIPA